MCETAADAVALVVVRARRTQPWLGLAGSRYLLGVAHPNFYFHATTAYDILRHNGVELGKRDFIGRP